MTRCGMRLWALRAYNAWPLARIVLTRRLLVARGAKVAQTSVCSRLHVAGKVRNLCIGEFSSIGRVYFQTHAKIEIGRHVVINDGAIFLTGSHDIHSATYDHIFAPIKVGDFAWIATAAMILQGVSIGEGAVVAAGAVVSKDVEPYTVVGGNPAKQISSRTRQALQYRPACWFAPVIAWIGKQ